MPTTAEAQRPPIWRLDSLRAGRERLLHLSCSLQPDVLHPWARLPLRGHWGPVVAGVA